MSYEIQEQYCHEVLAQLQREYEKAAKPYIEMLHRLSFARPPQTIITLDLAHAMGIIPRNSKYEDMKK